jgi:hypothetical protein
MPVLPDPIATRGGADRTTLRWGHRTCGRGSAKQCGWSRHILRRSRRAFYRTLVRPRGGRRQDGTPSARCTQEIEWFSATSRIACIIIWTTGTNGCVGLPGSACLICAKIGLLCVPNVCYVRRRPRRRLRMFRPGSDGETHPERVRIPRIADNHAATTRIAAA